jgi:hypothetical protein
MGRDKGSSERRGDRGACGRRQAFVRQGAGRKTSDANSGWRAPITRLMIHIASGPSLRTSASSRKVTSYGVMVAVKNKALSMTISQIGIQWVVLGSMRYLLSRRPVNAAISAALRARAPGMKNIVG